MGGLGKAKSANTQTTQLTDKLAELTQQLAAVQEQERRVLADYQNLQRRAQTERLKTLQFANVQLMESLLPPIEHLSRAAEQLKDPGLNMVIQDLWKALTAAGLVELNPLGEPFDLETMEVVEKQGEGNIVKQVVKRGYALHGQVIQHAQVIVGPLGK